MFQRAECTFREIGLVWWINFCKQLITGKHRFEIELFKTRKFIDFLLISPSPIKGIYLTNLQMFPEMQGKEVIIKILPRGFLDQSTISLRHKPLPSTAGHLDRIQFGIQGQYLHHLSTSKNRSKKISLICEDCNSI